MWFSPPASSAPQWRNLSVCSEVSLLTEMRSRLTFPRVEWRSGNRTCRFSPATPAASSKEEEEEKNHLFLFFLFVFFLFFSDGTAADCGLNKWIITLQIRRNLNWYTRRMRKRILWNYKGGKHASHDCSCMDGESVTLACNFRTNVFKRKTVLSSLKKVANEKRARLTLGDVFLFFYLRKYFAVITAWCLRDKPQCCCCCICVVQLWEQLLLWCMLSV